jgi:hypothetical protein
MAAGQGSRARLKGKADGQGCRTKVHVMVQYEIGEIGQ